MFPFVELSALWIQGGFFANEHELQYNVNVYTKDTYYTHVSVNSNIHNYYINICVVNDGALCMVLRFSLRNRHDGSLLNSSNKINSRTT